MGPVEAIFQSKVNLYNSYNLQVYNNSPADTRVFDLHRAHFLYGKIDRDGDAVILETQGNLVPTPAGPRRTEFVVDFVKDAFDDFSSRYRTLMNGGDLDRETVYGRELFIRNARRKGDLDFNYFQYYMNKIYPAFVNDHLSKDRRHEKITDFRSFVRVFLSYMSEVAYYFPLTKTGYILSIHCSPYISGLMVDVKNESHSTQDNASVIRYSSDPVHTFFVNQSKKYGFMIDRNAPWRMVFNLASGYSTNDGGARYMKEYGQTLDNVFDSYYYKAHLAELNNLKNIMRELYQTYYAQFSTYYKIEYFMPPVSETVPWVKGQSGCYALKSRQVKKDRDPYPLILGTVEQVDEYYLKIILKLRMLESGYKHDEKEMISRAKKVVEQHRAFGAQAALNYINNFTKGVYDSKFIRRGKNWYGQNYTNYVGRLREASEKLAATDQINYELTGTGNT